jgi:multidrug efflux system outer membrane protein
MSGKDAPVLAAALLGGALLAGCAVGPNYRRPEVAPPDAFRGQTPQGAASLADLAWWDVYKDPRLKELIGTALAQGFDARIAAARVEESAAAAAEVHGQLFPGVGYAGGADRGKNSLLGQPFTEGGGSTANGFDAYFGATWEFDLWGRVRRLDEAARARYLATEEARRGVLLSLVSNVAQAYYELLELDEELAIAREATRDFGESLKLFNHQLEAGVASRLDTASAEAAIAASEAKIPALETLIAAKENQISLLLGRAPGPIPREGGLGSLPAPPDVPAGLPSALLERRPDVRGAEDAARAANADIGVTIGGFLPRIGLSALFGGVSSQLNTLTASKSSLWSVGANVTGPLFQGGTLKGEYDLAKASWEEAKLRYEQTALGAFGDVSSALVARERLTEIRDQEERAVRANQDAVRISTQRYAAGRASYFEVLQAQQQLYPAQEALAQAKRDQYIAIVRLYMALGGGWNLKDADWAGPGPGP